MAPNTIRVPVLNCTYHWPRWPPTTTIESQQHSNNHISKQSQITVPLTPSLRSSAVLTEWIQKLQTVTAKNGAPTYPGFHFVENVLAYHTTRRNAITTASEEIGHRANGRLDSPSRKKKTKKKQTTYTNSHWQQTFQLWGM